MGKHKREFQRQQELDRWFRKVGLVALALMTAAFLILSAVNAYAWNPDLPRGGVAVDLFAAAASDSLDQGGSIHSEEIGVAVLFAPADRLTVILGVSRERRGRLAWMGRTSPQDENPAEGAMTTIFSIRTRIYLGGR